MCTLRQTARKLTQNCCRSFWFCFKAVSEARTHWHLKTLTLFPTHIHARTFHHALHWLRSLSLSFSLALLLRCCWGYCCYNNRIKSNIYDAQTTESCQSFAPPPPLQFVFSFLSLSLRVTSPAAHTHTHTRTLNLFAVAAPPLFNWISIC